MRLLFALIAICLAVPFSGTTLLLLSGNGHSNHLSFRIDQFLRILAFQTIHGISSVNATPKTSSFIEDCCETKLSYLCPQCWGKCPVRDNPAKKLKELLDKKFFGQQHIREKLISMLEFHEGANRLTSFHIGGDNGVGKTHITRILAEARFQGDYHDGFLEIPGSSLIGANNEKLRNQLFNAVLKQLEKCPDSIIVIDETQLVHPTTLIVLQKLLDESEFILKLEEGRRVRKSRAFLGFISDFGKEGLTAHMTLDEMEEKVMNTTREIWDINEKEAQMITYIFPFAPLTDEDFEGILTYEITKEALKLDKFKKIAFLDLSDSAKKWMRVQVQRKYPAENGRGIKKWIENEFYPKLGREIDNKKGKLRVSVDYNAGLKFNTLFQTKEL